MRNGGGNHRITESVFILDERTLNFQDSRSRKSKGGIYRYPWAGYLEKSEKEEPQGGLAFYGVRDWNELGKEAQ